MTDLKLIVADSFRALAGLESVLTVSELISRLEKNKPVPPSVVIGQGLTECSIGSIKAAVRRSGAMLTLYGEEVLHDRASHGSTHKRRRENILIADPVPVGPGTFTSDLLMDEAGELLSDHLTGYHIQGIVLIEAARQMFLAVIEKHLLKNYPSYCVINYLNTSFQRFAFPVAVSISLNIVSTEFIKNAHVIVAQIEFSQNDLCVTRVDTQFSVFDEAILAPKERSMASAIVAKTLEDAVLSRSHTNVKEDLAV